MSDEIKCNCCEKLRPKNWVEAGWLRAVLSLTNGRGTVRIFMCPEHQGLEHMNPFYKEEAKAR